MRQSKKDKCTFKICNFPPFFKLITCKNKNPSNTESTLDLSYPAPWRNCSQGLEEKEILADFYPFTNLPVEERTDARLLEFKKAFRHGFSEVESQSLVYSA